MTGVANAAQGALIHDRDATTDNITFNVKDTAAALVQNEAKLDLANDVSVGGEGDNDLTVAEAVKLTGITNFDDEGLHYQ